MGSKFGITLKRTKSATVWTENCLKKKQLLWISNVIKSWGLFIWTQFIFPYHSEELECKIHNNVFTIDSLSNKLITGLHIMWLYSHNVLNNKVYQNVTYLMHCGIEKRTKMYPTMHLWILPSFQSRICCIKFVVFCQME